MAGHTTKPYKNTFSGSVGAGMGSLFSPSGRKYYILEHKVSSKYHRAGENQEIIVDNIELGRDSHCQVRFDEKFQTVSRHHAAIVKDGDMWKLVQISKTNSTFLNGRPVKTEWYLQSGDEIQLSVNGPKMGFILPTGKKSTVASIGLTRRLSLFRQQALRPYKTAIAALTILLVLSVGGLGTWSYIKGNEYERLIAQAESKLGALKEKNTKLEKLIADADKEQKRLDSLLKAKSQPIHKTVIVRQGGSGGGKNGSSNVSALQQYEDDIFFLDCYLVVEYQGKPIPLETTDGGVLGWTGTGFLMNDGRFVTAKHCVEGWKFWNLKEIKEQLAALKDGNYQTLFLMALAGNGAKFHAVIMAKSPSKELKLISSRFKMDTSGESRVKLTDDISYIKSSLDGGSDWACIDAGARGKIIPGTELSSSLPAGARLEVLGYPKGFKAKGGSCLYGSCQTSSRGLNDGMILITGKNYEKGNSGGPVFYNDNGTYKAVGVVSFSMFNTMGGLTPLYNVR